MAIPDFQSLMLPLLRAARDQQEHAIAEVVDTLADEFSLSEVERNELLPSKRQRRFDNRVHWARTYLKEAGLLEATRRGHLRITQEGLNLLKQPPDRITIRYLDQFPGMREFRAPRAEQSTSGEALNPDAGDSERDTPEELLEQAFGRLNESLEAELLARLKSVSPAYFEQIVIDALVAIGYGGSQSDAGEALGRTGDGGVDGVIREDRLGLDLIYVQAKRWEGSVGRPRIQEFVGALQGRRARKGVFITTSGFTKEAWDYAGNVDVRIVLIDGRQLARLMVEHGVGVATRATYVIRKIDSDYFEED